MAECLEDHPPKPLRSHWDVLPLLHPTTNNPKCKRKKHARWLKWEVGVTKRCDAVNSSPAKSSNHSPQNTNKYSHGLLHDTLWELSCTRSIETQQFQDEYKLGYAPCPTEHGLWPDHRGGKKKKNKKVPAWNRMGFPGASSLGSGLDSTGFLPWKMWQHDVDISFTETKFLKGKLFKIQVRKLRACKIRSSLDAVLCPCKMIKWENI